MAKRNWWRFRVCARGRCWITTGVLAWLVFATWMLFVAISREGVVLPAFFAIYLLLTVTCSVLAFVLVAIDKRRAIQAQPRISDRTLHVLAALGGWPGAYLARRWFRHKTWKLSFRALAWLIIAVHGLILAYGLWSGWYWYGVKALFSLNFPGHSLLASIPAPDRQAIHGDQFLAGVPTATFTDCEPKSHVCCMICLLPTGQPR